MADQGFSHERDRKRKRQDDQPTIANADAARRKSRKRRKENMHASESSVQPTRHAPGPPSTTIVATNPTQSSSASRRARKKERTRRKHHSSESKHEQGPQHDSSSRKRGREKPRSAFSPEVETAVFSTAPEIQDEKALVPQSSKVRRRHTTQRNEHVPQNKEARGQIAAYQSPWSKSEPIGGRFIDAPPQMSADESHIICATESSLTAYSSSNSLPVQKLYHERSKDFFTTFTNSKIDTDTVLACTHDGLLQKWNFVDGSILMSRRLEGSVQSIRSDTNADGKEIIYTLTAKDRKWSISNYFPRADEDNVEPVLLLKHDSPIRAFEVREQGSVIVGITTSGVLVGTAARSSLEASQQDYVWRDITCSEPPMCFDVKVKARENERNNKNRSKKSKHQDVPSSDRIDVVVGGLKGSIFVFQDILQRFETSDQAGTKKAPRDQQLHWHRKAVGSLAWSLDGQYIVSGGKETVLVLWQLETGRKTFLPHLESPILDISVSPKGASYIIRLADNSVMVLSTSELSPTSHIAGPQTSSFSRAVVPTSHLATVDLMRQFGEEAPTNVAAIAINPHSPGQLLASVPAHQASFTVGGPLSPAPYLQSYDISTASFIYRQALTRTNATNHNLGPEGNSLFEPNVKHLQASQDGRWLVTVDEWQGPSQDVKDLSVDGLDVPSTLESKLRFWLWDEVGKQWMLNSRIDEPHRLEHYQTTLSVLALASDPSASRFATLGADSVVRTWTLKSKLKNGKVVRGEVQVDAKGKSRMLETWWAIESTVYVEQAVAFDSFRSVRPDRGCLAFSNDGSMLAVAQHYDVYDSSSPTVHFIDVSSGNLHDSRTGLYEGDDGIHALGFLGQSLIILGRESAAVWDVTTFSLHALISPPSYDDPKKDALALVKAGSSSRHPRPIPHLAVNVATGTFAIASPERSRTNAKLDVHPLLKYRTNLSIYSPGKGADAIYTATLPRTTMALLSAGGVAGIAEQEGEDFTGQKNGYVILDLGAEVRVIKQDVSGMGALPTPPPSDEGNAAEAVAEGDEDEVVNDESSGKDEDASDASDDEAMDEDEEEDEEIILPPKDADTRPVVRREQLAEVFEHPPLAMPSMHELFDRVLKMCAEKPRARSPMSEGGERKAEDQTMQDDAVGRDSEDDEDDESESDSDLD